MPPPTLYHDPNLFSGTKAIHNPPLDTISKAELGENLYEKSNMVFADTYKVKLLENAKGKHGGFLTGYIDTSITSLSYLTGPLFKWSPENYNTICWGHINCLVDVGNTGYFTHTAHYQYKDLGKLEKPAKYNLIPDAPSFANDSFKYVALYQGRIGNIIKISFREFKDNLARPAFTQDIDYELDKDGTVLIGFKGLRIQVLNASNLDITYKVLADYK